MYQVRWGEKEILAEKIVSRFELKSPKGNIEERHALLNGYFRNTRLTPVRSKALLLQFRIISDSVIKHFFRVSGGFFEIKSAEFAFKVGEDLKVWLLWVSRITTTKQTSENIRKKESESFKKCNSLFSSFVEPVELIRPLLTKNRPEIVKTFKEKKFCFQCFKSHIKRDIVSISYQELIDFQLSKKANLWYNKKASPSFECESEETLSRKKGLIDQAISSQEKKSFFLHTDIIANNKIGILEQVNFFLCRTWKQSQKPSGFYILLWVWKIIKLL